MSTKMDIEKAKDRLLTPEETLARLSLEGVYKDPRRMVRLMGSSGKIRIVRVGKYIRVSEQSVDKLIAGAK